MSLTVDGIPARPVRKAALARRPCPQCRADTKLALLKEKEADGEGRYFLLCLGLTHLEASCWETREIGEAEAAALLSAGDYAGRKVCPFCQKHVNAVIDSSGRARLECDACNLDVTDRIPGEIFLP